MAKKTIEIKEFGIEIVLDSGDYSSTNGAWASGTIKSNFNVAYSHVSECLRSIILEHARLGIDVTQDRYVSGIRTACESCVKATE